MTDLENLPIILKQEYFYLKQLLIDGKIDVFDFEIGKLQFNELLEFGRFCQKTYKGSDFLNDYFGIKILGEVMYLITKRDLLVLNPKEFDEQKFWDLTFRGIATAAEKSFDLGFYSDAEKYCLRVIEYPKINKKDAIGFLSKLAMIANIKNEPVKELNHCEQMMKLDGKNPNIIINYAYSLNRNKLYDKARNYLEQLDDKNANYFQKYNYLVLNTIYGWQDYKKAYKYLEKIAELSNGGKELNERNKYLYFHNSLIVWSLSGDKEFLNNILEFKKNAEKISDKQASNGWYEISSISELINKGIFDLNVGNFDKAKEFFNSVLKYGWKGQFPQLAQFLKNICEIIQENQRLHSQPIEKLPKYIDELLLFIQQLETEELFQEYKDILINYFDLLKSFVLVLTNNQLINDLDKRKLVLQEFHHKNLTTSEFISKSFQLLKLIDDYLDEFPKTILKEITKQNYILKLQNLINSPFEVNSETKFLYSLNSVGNINNALCETIVKGIKLIQTNEPSFIKDLKSQKTNSLLETDFRNHFYYIFGLSNDTKIDAEGLSRVGRTDLRIESNKFGTKTFEFKIWGRHNHKEVVKQIYEYLTDFENEGFIFMVNPNEKKEIDNEYLSNLRLPEMDFITLETQEINGFKYYISKHKINVKIKTIYHFIYNVY